MNTNSDFITPHLMGIAMPSTKGHFSILPTGAIIGYPESEAVTTWHYLPSGTLAVYFTGYGKAYFYKNVPFAQVMRLMTTDSVGTFINKVIKPNYEFFT